MARGWESKAVEAQIETANSRSADRKTMQLSFEEIQLKQKREGLLLSRSRIRHDLEAARNPRYRRMLEDVLGCIERQLAELAELQ